MTFNLFSPRYFLLAIITLLLGGCGECGIIPDIESKQALFIDSIYVTGSDKAYHEKDSIPVRKGDHIYVNAHFDPEKYAMCERAEIEARGFPIKLYDGRSPEGGVELPLVRPNYSANDPKFYYYDSSKLVFGNNTYYICLDKVTLEWVVEDFYIPIGDQETTVNITAGLKNLRGNLNPYPLCFRTYDTKLVKLVPKEVAAAPPTAVPPPAQPTLSFPPTVIPTIDFTDTPLFTPTPLEPKKLRIIPENYYRVVTTNVTRIEVGKESLSCKYVDTHRIEGMVTEEIAEVCASKTVIPGTLDCSNDNNGNYTYLIDVYTGLLVNPGENPPGYIYRGIGFTSGDEEVFNEQGLEIPALKESWHEELGDWGCDTRVLNDLVTGIEVFLERVCLNTKSGDSMETYIYKVVELCTNAPIGGKIGGYDFCFNNDNLNVITLP